MINKKGVALVIANSAYITQPKLSHVRKTERICAVP